ncbi:MAG TPA: YifB family Mg chelatase-like AAA ATPase [Myxococcota bacterium]|nr:YifB family Mg chelatase-like AAA ATPase [Myxococcota bacterium]
MIGISYCAALSGFVATKVRVEVDISRGLPAFQLVGLPENSVKEARVRVRSAIINAGFEFPRGKIWVNLAPADVQKNGTSFDLPIALAILQSAGIIAKTKLQGIAAVGELSLTGEIKAVRGMLILSESIKEQGLNTLLVSEDNAQEASLIEGITIKVVRTLGEMVRAINAQKLDELPNPRKSPINNVDHGALDMADVVGQEEARRALLIAAAGNHNLLFIGGPGSGKSMMAHRLPTILPPLSYEESVTLTKIYSIAGHTIAGRLINQRPFRCPHHSTTKAGLTGGGSKSIRPGEISLACYGVLFLDELLEFPRTVLEVLRQPLEEGQITLSRASMSATYPAEISLIGALNPCPCGNFGQGKLPCSCLPQSIERYQSRLSGPLIDRIDLHVQVPPLDLNLMTADTSNESSRSMREKVVSARALQKKRFGGDMTNGKMDRARVKEAANLTNAALRFLITCGESLRISARSFDRIIRVARTIADLDNSNDIHEHHIGEAFHYRPVKSLIKV